MISAQIVQIENDAKAELYRILDNFHTKLDSFQITFARINKEMTKAGYAYTTSRKVLKQVISDSLIDGYPYIVSTYVNHNDEMIVIVCNSINLPLITEDD